MKKLSTVLLLILIVSLLTICLVACDDTYTVTFDYGDGSVTTQKISAGSTVNIPQAPEKNGYTFDGWYLGGVEFDFTQAITSNITLVAGWTPVGSEDNITVTFDYGDDNTVTQDVTSGETVSAPQAPEKDDYIFGGWYLDGEEFDFSTAITEPITLVAKWNAATNTVTFKSEDAVYKSASVNYGEKVSRPTAPKRDGYSFGGWYLDNEEFDFSTAITEPITLVAKWLSNEQMFEKLEAALAADYSNYTAVRTVYEYYDGTTLFYTETYKRTDAVATYLQVQETCSDKASIIPFDSNGNPVIVYYLDSADGKWKKSENNIFGYYLLPLNMGAIYPEYFECVEGRFFVLDDCAQFVEYALFGTMGQFCGLYLDVQDGHIVNIGGEAYLFDGEFTLTLSQFGTTEISLPEDLPELDVTVKGNNKEYIEGRAISLENVLALFSIDVDGRTIAVTEDMLSLGGLNLESPAEGTYTVTCTYTLKNDDSYSDTATVTIVPVQASDLTFAEIFAQDYIDMTVTYNNTEYLVNGELMYWLASSNKMYVALYDGGFTLVRHNTNVNTVATVAWQRFLRIDAFFALDADLFVQDDDDENLYVLDSSMDIDSDTLALLTTLFKQNESTANAIVVTTDYNFAVYVIVDGNYISQISLTYYSKTSANGTPTEKTCTFEISNIGSTEAIEASDEVLALLYPDTEE